MIYLIVYIAGALLTAAVVAALEPHDEAIPVVFALVWPLAIPLGPLVVAAWVGRRVALLRRRRAAMPTLRMGDG